MIGNSKEPNWFFCRGYFVTASNSFLGYTQAELGGARAGYCVVGCCWTRMHAMTHGVYIGMSHVGQVVA